jgi:hypothetical protein
MKLKKIKNFYIRSLFKDNQADDTNLVKSIFKRKLNIPLNLTNSEITKQKYLVMGGSKDIDLLDICKKISNEDIKINIHTTDIFYEYEYKNKKK